MSAIGKSLLPILLLVSLGVSPGTAEEIEVEDRETARIAAALQREILRLPSFGVFDDLDFSIQGSTVTLMGYASRPKLKNSAERVAKSVEGVEEVFNQIEVLPALTNDDRIRASVYVAIYGNRALRHYGPGTFPKLTQAALQGGITRDPPRGFHAIHIIVKRGNVILEGVVSSVAHKAIAGIKAQDVGGVFQVTNDLVVIKQKDE